MLITLVVGRTASGKDYLANLLTKNQGWHFAKSYATRPKRTPNEDTHIFISEEEAANFPKDQIVTDTIINNVTYFVTKEELLKSDGYIVNPNAIPKLLEKCPDIFFQIVYLKPSDEKTRTEMVANRPSDNPDEIKIYNQRKKAEDEEFSKFEQQIQNGEAYGDNYDTIMIVNDYNLQTMHNVAATAEWNRRFHKNMYPIVLSMIKHGLMELEDNKVVIWDRTNPNKRQLIPIEKLIKNLGYDNQDSKCMLADTLTNWLSIMDKNIDPSIYKKPDYIQDENKNLFNAWLLDVITQQIPHEKQTKPKHTTYCGSICEQQHNAHLTDYIIKTMINDDGLYGLLLHTLQTYVRKTMKEIVTPV